MERKIIITVLLIFCILQSGGQTVGLVLSGGGAKGLYHIGIIKALEENNIPIDYVSGASMGAIVGGFYVIGASPDDMIRFFESDSVSYWIRGEIPAEYKYFFKNEGMTPDMVTVNFKGLEATTKGGPTLKLPTSILSTDIMDIAFTNILQGASWAAHQNFDSLMVPFRCVASDIYNKKSVLFKNGSLPFAIRSSMAIPLVFKPLKKDSTLLWDGGVYNNFPWQCLKEDFHPDVLIGCVCAGNEKNPKEDDVFGQLMTMLTSQTDYSLPDSKNNILIKRRFYDVGTLDYDMAPQIIKSGYDDAMAMMPKIKEIISRRVDSVTLKKKRDSFKRKIKPLIFDSVTIDGVTDAQKSYLYHQLRYLKQGEDYNWDYFVRNYLRILSAGVFNGSFPDITYNPVNERYQLHLHMSTKRSFNLTFGGNISSTSLNQVYLGINYSHVNRIASSYSATGLLGTFYNAFSVSGRHDIFTNFPFFIQYNYTWQQYDYSASHMSRYNNASDGRLGNNINNEFHLSLGASAFTNYVFKINWTLAKSEFIFYPFVYVSGEHQDRMDYYYSKLNLQIGKNSLNYRMFPSLGLKFQADIRYFGGYENYKSEYYEPTFSGKNRSWLEGEISLESYHHLHKYFNLGYLIDLKVSNAPSFGTEFSTYFMRKQFTPTPISSVMFMTQYRSASYLGLGIMPIINFTKSQKLFLKTYAYCYIPQELVYENGNWITPTIHDFTNKINGIFGGSLVYQTPLGPASISYDKYTTGNNWAIILNFGCAIFRLNKD